MFIMKAEESFKSYPFVKYQILDIEKDLEEQGMDLHSYDIVVASDVLHATKSLSGTLKNVQKLLAPGGMLLMLEVTKCPTWLDLVFGLTEGWWMFQDFDLRPNHPSMPEEKWDKLFTGLGFSEFQGFTDGGKNHSKQHVYLARNKDFKVEEQESKLPDTVIENPGNWIIFKDDQGISEVLCSKLESQGQICINITIGKNFKSISDNEYEVDPSRQEDLTSLFKAVSENNKPVHGVIHLWSTNKSDKEITIEALEQSYISGSTSALNLLRELVKFDPKNMPKLWIVTNGAQSIDSDENILSIDQTSIWGLGRVFINEHQNLSTTCVDLSKKTSREEIDLLFDEICAVSQEEEVAFRGDKRYLHKLLRISPEKAEENAMKKIEGENIPYTLTIDTYGVLDNLKYRETPKKKPGYGEVEVEIFASALNFKDVMLSMGLLDKAALENVYTGASLGMECSGKIVSVGEGVSDFQIGDEVLAIGPGCFGSSVITKSTLVVKKPSHLSYEEAATIPMVYLTAYYSIVYLGRLQKDEKILIHSATGGVGLAAINLARQIGAEIYATAGNDQKREYLKSLGVKHVMDSRSLDFASQIMELTNGKGVDLVLNSLSGTALSKSVDLLGEYGRFVEIGKTDIYENSKLSLRPFANNLSYYAVDIDKLLLKRDELCGQLFKDFMKFFDDNTFVHHPYKSFPASQVTDAFQFMAQAKHVGKVIVTMKDESLKILPSTDISTVINDQSSYVITGGCSGFGLSIAKKLVDFGAKHLVLISRSGPKTDEDKQMIHEMEISGVHVYDARADVSSNEQVAEVFEKVNKTMPEIKGIIHSAMVIEDTVSVDIDHEKLMKVIRPKVFGAMVLHNLTEKMSLDFFVSFSSMSSIYGNAGQGNYSAANAFLDGFSFYRRSKGLPATTINWGVIGEAGYVAQNVKVANILASQGWKSFNTSQTYEILEKTLLINPTQIVALHTDWPTVGKFFPMAVQSARFSHLVHEGMDSKGGSAGQGSSLLQSLLSADPDKRVSMLQKEVHEQIARILGTSSSKIEVNEPINNMGLDSLMANQLRNWIQQNLNYDFSMMKIMRGPTIIELTNLLLQTVEEQKSDNNESDSEENILDKWILRKNLNGDAKLRLFCFPYMAGGAYSFIDWADKLPESIEVCAIQLPGREERLGEEAFDDIDNLVTTVSDVIMPLLDKPFAFYGHSSGAAMAFKLSHYLKNNHNLLPEKLFLGAWYAPHLASPFRILDKVQDEDFESIPENLIYDHLRTLEIPETVLEDADLMNEMIPSIRADMMMGKNYVHAEKDPLECPITVFAGKNDSVFSFEQIKAWKNYTKENFTFKEVEGNHLFLNENKEVLLKMISEELE
jgi:NADPH:quinone reductase-like Zn-dependent oxidoreductase/surfactin synthase thioesterase subunit/NADP-dependent 3-hydroxy acid dehydrogenase YdfG/aryl carrier-like protein